MRSNLVLLCVAILMFADTNGTNETDNNEREPLKLYPKQKVILNQILSFYALNKVVNNTLCEKHTEEFKIGLRAFEPWALKMFDSSSKLQPGIFNGNLMEYGSFKQCVNIYYESSEHGPIRGQQCLVKITPTANIVEKILGFRNITHARFKKINGIVEGASLLWSVCVPDSCRSDDVLRHFNRTILSVTQGLDLNITVKDYDCYSLKETKPLGKGEWLVIIFFALLLIAVIISTIVDVLTREGSKNTNKMAQIFSAYANTEYLLADNFDKENQTNCLDGFRAISMLYVLFGHRFIMLLFFPTTNGLEITEWLNTYVSTVITAATASVDTFFMISGLLACYQTCTYLANGNKFNLSLYYFHRYIRITPSVAVLVAILATTAHRFGSGPLWKLTAKKMQVPCQYFWWSTLLHLQNYINPKYICILQTWYLTCDMQFHFYSPVLIYPLYKWPTYGYIISGLVYASSITVSFYLAWINKYAAIDLTTNNLPRAPFFVNHYIKPYTRAPTFILGVLFGYLLFRVKGTRIKMSKSTLFCGWCASTALALSFYIGAYVFQLENYPYNRLEQSIYLTFARSGWILSMIWIIWVCSQGYGGVINTFLSSYAFRVLGKISYSIYLIHMPFQFMSFGSHKLPAYFSNFDGTQQFLSDLVLMIIPSYLLTICIECPIVRLENMFLKKGGKNAKKVGDNKIFVQVRK